MKLFEHLGRITTSGRTFIPQIDGLRFIAIMMVIGHHSRAAFQAQFWPGLDALRGNWVNDIFLAGNQGVLLFFAISGFVIALPFVRWRLGDGKAASLRDYYWRRLTRIEPPYVIHLVLLLLMCALMLHHTSGDHRAHDSKWLASSAQHILASLVYSNGVIYAEHPHPNPVLWSLEVEVQFYLLAPLFLQVFRLNPAWLRRGTLAGAIIILEFTKGPLGNWLGNPYYVWASILGNLHYFFIGFLLADWWVSAEVGRRVSLFWDVGFIAACAAAVWGHEVRWLADALPLVIAVGMISGFKGQFTSIALSNPWVTTTGGMCYTIYLYHGLMILVIIRLVTPLRTHILWIDLLICFFVMCALVVPACAVLFVLFERPFMRGDWPARVRERFSQKPRTLISQN